MKTRNIALALIATQAFVTVASAQTSYTLIKAHQPITMVNGVWVSGGENTELYGINDNGDAVGMAGELFTTRMHRWNVATGHVTVPITQGLARVITNQGDIAGTKYTTMFGLPSAFFGFAVINGVHKQVWACQRISQGVYDYNPALGRMVGVGPTTLSLIDAPERGMYQVGNTVTLLNPPTGAPADSSTHLFGVNSSGMMAGDAVFIDGRKAAITWDGTTLTRFAAPGSLTSTARAINDSGIIAGSAEISGVTKGFLHIPGTGYVFPGAIPGSAAGSSVEFLDINNSGVAVGTGQMFPTDPRAVVTVNGVTKDLNTMTQTGGWTLETANAISNNGMIVGTARHQGVKRGFILVPNKSVRVQVNLNDFTGPSLIDTYLEVIDAATGNPVSGAGANLTNGGEMGLGAYPNQFRLRIKGRASLTYTSPVYNKASVTENQLFTYFLTNGDVDGSGEVDAADIDEVIADFGQTSAWILSDVDGSGEVDAADIDIVIANFGQTNN